VSVRATAALPPNHGKGKPFDTLTLTHDQRRLRRKLITLPKGEEVMVDFPDAVSLEHFGGLLLEDGRVVEVFAAPESLYEVTARSTEHLAQLAWHIGNRHISAQIEKKRILIPRDHVARQMLAGLDATIREVSEAFSPERGAYHEHAH
jgi:urease accessory protein